LTRFRFLQARLHIAGRNAADLAVGLGGLAVTRPFGRELLGLIYGPRFAEAADVFPWIMLVGVALYAQTPFGYGLTAT
jgi:O-antigen/teichoic acid export membrane protein